MKTLLVFAMLVVFSCTSQENESICESYCDAWSIAYTNNAEVLECSISDESASKYVDRCDVACHNAYMSAENRYSSSIDKCLVCLTDTVDGTQVPMTFNDLMWSDCQSECKSTIQFFASFFVIEPQCNKKEVVLNEQTKL